MFREFHHRADRELITPQTQRAQRLFLCALCANLRDLCG
jgi:hypothetical protein